VVWDDQNEREIVLLTNHLKFGLRSKPSWEPVKTPFIFRFGQH
jgi:hypothetical protein